MPNIVNQAATVYGYQGAAAEWATAGDLYIWNSPTLNTIGASIDASNLALGETIQNATLDMQFGTDLAITQFYQWRMQVENAANPAVLGAARLPRSVTVRAAEVLDSLTANPTANSAYQLNITSILQDLATAVGIENIGNINFIMGQVTATTEYLSWAAAGGCVLNVTVGGTAPVITSVDGDNTVFDGQTNVVIAGSNFGSNTGQFRVRVNSQADGLGTDVVQSLVGATVSDTSITLATLDLTGITGNAYFFVRNDSGDENAVGFDTTVVTAPGTIVMTGSANRCTGFNGFIYANETGLITDIYDRITGALVYRQTGMATDANGDFTTNIINASIVIGTFYRMVTHGFAGGQENLRRNVQAT